MKPDGGVPLVELETVHHLKFVTDNMGIAVIEASEFQDQEVYFSIKSHGYEFRKDGFGFRGKKVHVNSGSSAVLKIQRKILAERLCRLTGAGLYSDSVKVGKQAPISQPLLNAKTAGSDSAHVAEFGGKLFWIWGDTHRIGYPLGNFQVTAATSPLDKLPLNGIDYLYFRDDKGFAKKMANFPGTGPTWLDALVTLRDEQGRERLVASYVKVEPPLTIYERGLCEFDTGTEQFKPLLKLPMDQSPIPERTPVSARRLSIFWQPTTGPKNSG